MESSLLEQSRIQLKLSLFYGRSVITTYGLRPICAVCGLAIYEDPDMHEAIMTRAVVQGSDADIMVKQNCVLVHPGGSSGKCHSKAQTKEGRRLCIEHIIYYLGYNSVRQWIESLSEQLSPITIRERLSFIEEYRDAE
jgi:hypothetical protein